MWKRFIAYIFKEQLSIVELIFILIITDLAYDRKLFAMAAMTFLYGVTLSLRRK
jgi:hypothetical protein